MDNRALLDLAAGGIAVGGWFLAFGLARLVTRPASPQPEPATPDLGAEPPAVVSLLANHWTITEDAAESTLLDLAARHFVELRQPGDEPMQTTVHLPATPPDDSGLRPYERRVLSRIRGLAENGVVPLTALTFRNESQAKSWNKRLRAEVIADARAAGLSRRRFGPALITALSVLAAIAAVVTGAAVFHYGVWSDSEDNGGLGAGIVTFVLLSGIAAASPGERDTPLGRQVAARWLGVRDWLHGHEQFAELPPAAVMVWDRYLGYGAAVGVTRLSSAILDLGMGNRKLVWSSFGGTWHRVRVHYPRFWTRYGRTTAKLVLRAAITIVVGVVLLVYGRRVLDTLPDRVRDIGLTISAIVLLTGLYKLARTLVDLATERMITGEVLWLELWLSESQGKEQPSRPWLHYLAVDDGTDSQTKAWGLPTEWAGRCHDGDTVTIRVRPWSRRVVDLTVIGQGRSRALYEPPTGDIAADRPARATAAAAGGLLTAEEVAQALGRPVRAGDAMALGGVVGGTQFLSADNSAGDGKPVLIVQTLAGTAARWAWRANSRGQALPGIGDGAFASGERAALRVGETTVVLTLMGDARDRQTYLPWLAAQCAARLSPTEGRSPAPR